MNRRDFLKNAAWGTAVIGAPIAFGDELQPRPKPKAPMQGLRRELDMPHPNLDPDDYVYSGKAKPFTGKVTCNGRPLAGVIVTNGRDSVKTDKDGVYNLPVWKDARFITVTTPSGYASPLHYIDVGRLLGGYDFRLEVSPQTAPGKPCRFVHIADSEIKNPAYGAWCNDIRDLAAREDCAFIVHTGDICGREGLIAHIQVMNTFSMGRRVVYTAGNHDLVSLWPWGEAAFEGIYGPSWYSFEACGVHFVVVPHVNGDRNPSYDEDQLADWIRGDLALVDPKRPVVMLRHYLCNDGSREKAGVVFGDKRPLDLRKACNFKGCVYGHSHNSWIFRRGGATFVNTSNPQIGGIDHSPNTARVITVTEEGMVSTSYFGDMQEMKSERAGAVWETQLPAAVMWGGFCADNTTLYCATSDDDGRGTAFICALSKETGKLRWQTKIGNTIKGALAIAQDLVIGTDVEGKVWAVEMKTGQLKWSVDLVAAVKTGLSYGKMISHGTVASPDGTKVIAGIGYTQALLAASTGEILWQGGGQAQKEACAISPTFAGDKVITPYNWAPTLCNDIKTGKVLWKFGGFNFPGARPHLVGDKVLIVNKDSVNELELATGKVLRTKRYANCSLALPGDLLETEKLYLKGTSGRGLLAIDKETLDVVWEAKPEPGLVAQSEYAPRGRIALSTTPVRFDAKTVCATNADGYIHFWNLADGKEVHRIKTGAPYLASAYVADGKVFVVDMTGKARSFAVKL